MHQDNELFRLVVENIEDYAIFVLDSSRTIRTWNRGAELLLGYKAEEIAGRSADVIFTPEDIEAGAPEREAATALEAGKAEDNRWHVRKDGSRLWGSGMMIRLDDGPQGVRGLAKILRDQTSLKLAEDERDRAEAARRRRPVFISWSAAVWASRGNPRSRQKSREALHHGRPSFCLNFRSASVRLTGMGSPFFL